MTNKSFILGIDYNLEDGRVVFTSEYLKRRGYCCGNGCKNCPYIPKHLKDNKNTDEEKVADSENS